MFEFLTILFSLIIDGYVAAGKASPFWSQMIIAAVLLTGWRFLKSALAIEAPAKRALHLNIWWDTIWSVLAIIGILQWLCFVPSSQGKLLLLFFGLPLMVFIGFPFYLLLIHGIFIIGLYIWAKWKQPEMMPRTGWHNPLFLIAFIAFGILLLMRWKVSGRIFL